MSSVNPTRSVSSEERSVSRYQHGGAVDSGAVAQVVLDDPGVHAIVEDPFLGFPHPFCIEQVDVADAAA